MLLQGNQAVHRGALVVVVAGQRSLSQPLSLFQIPGENVDPLVPEGEGNDDEPT